MWWAQSKSPASNPEYADQLMPSGSYTDAFITSGINIKSLRQNQLWAHTKKESKVLNRAHISENVPSIAIQIIKRIFSESI